MVCTHLTSIARYSMYQVSVHAEQILRFGHVKVLKARSAARYSNSFVQ